MIQTKKQMFIVIGVFVLVFMLGTVSFAFFNYTRTGGANAVSTGHITFNAEQDDAVTLSDLFPINVTGNITSETPGVGSLAIHVTGDTEYTGGIEYLVKAVNVTDTNGTALPISISIGYEASTGNNKTIGTEDENYFTNRGGNTSRYKVLSNDTINEGQDLVVGYIAPGETGIDGNIIIMAYLDARNIAITDTLENGNIVVNGYTNGTTDTGDGNWVNGRTVMTTSEWNALQASGVSFQIKVEAQEGTWVNSPMTLPTLDEMCPNCMFMYPDSENTYNYGTNGTLVNDITDTYSSDYNEILSTSGKNYFLGFTISNNRIDRAFSCGVKHENPNQGMVFCIEGTTDGSSYDRATSILTYIYGIRIINQRYGCQIDPGMILCTGAAQDEPGAIFATARSEGSVDVNVNDDLEVCFVANNGELACWY